MGSVGVLRERCRDLGIGLRVGETGIVIDAAPGLVTPEIRAQLVGHRIALADLLIAEAAYVAAGERIAALNDEERYSEARALINEEYAEAGDRMARYADADFWGYIRGLRAAG